MNSSLLEQRHFDIAHASEVSAARRFGQQLAESLQLDDIRAGRLAILVTELATNMLKHAQGGRLIVSQARINGLDAIELLALDKGPGIANLDFSFLDGNSSTGTSGNGLGALRRLSDEFDVYTAAGKGTAFFVRVWQTAPKAGQEGGIQSGAICVPMHGEDVCGDAWAIAGERTQGEQAEQFSVMVSDGLGHGPDAAAASAAALAVLRDRPGDSCEDLVKGAHTALRATRGAALAVAKINLADSTLTFAGIGNISAHVIDGDSRRQIMSHNGIVGNNVRKIQEFVLPFPPRALCILHSDGINTQWGIERYPGLAFCHPALIAGILLRDFERGRDDVTALVIRNLG
ncbi:SpoIIE family protein phosphatase [Undibacterium sp. TJN25]|uniref:SpoIIE family protein phosphatase n=1 Tax=Undibacterium sp. TJN25 TaxID=3413056 RepID=UPI003BF3BE57